MSEVNIIYRDNGAGLVQDMKIVKSLLEQEHVVRVVDFDSQKTVKEADLNIFLEVLKREFVNKARKNIIIPNPEWFSRKWSPVIQRNFDAIFCKTKDAVNLFNNIGDCIYTSFTSKDRYDGRYKKEYKFGHFPGVSQTKGTDVAIKTWKRNPEFPELRMITPKHVSKKVEAENINHTVDYVSEKQIRKEQNKAMFHLCPTDYEGFGHFINEARSCKAVVVTTGAGPMKELVDGRIGFHIEPREIKPKSLAKTYVHSPMLVSKAVNEALELDDDMLKQMGEMSRERYLKNDRFFRKRFMNEVEKYVQ